MDIVERVIRTLSADTALVGLSTGGIWEAIAPRDKDPPYIIVNVVIDATAYTHDKKPAYRSGTVTVKAITKGGGYGEAEPIRDRFDTVLHALNTSHGNGIQSIVRGPTIRYPELDGDDRYNHLGYPYDFMYREP